ncbi:unnamed protein product, partial [Timema podura]|nr:unnamed protein product [Timema podura]
MKILRSGGLRPTNKVKSLSWGRRLQSFFLSVATMLMAIRDESQGTGDVWSAADPTLVTHSTTKRCSQH